MTMCVLYLKENVRYNDDDDNMVIRSPRSTQKQKNGKATKYYPTQINGQMLAI